MIQTEINPYETDLPGIYWNLNLKFQINKIKKRLKFLENE